MAKSVLVIDDDKEFAETVLRYELEQMGHVVRTVSDLYSAREALANQIFALVTVDMNLHRGRDRAYFEGESILEDMRVKYRGIPCIIISGSTSPSRSFAMARQYDMVPEDGYIEKQNFDRKVFRNIVIRILGVSEVTHMSKVYSDELSRLYNQLQSMNDVMESFEREYKDGTIDIGRYNQLKLKYGTDRYRLIGQVQALIKSQGYDDLSESLEKAKSQEAYSVVKSDLKEQAEKKGWGKHILDEIEKHKGDIVGLIVNIAVELGKKAMTGL